MTRTRKTVTLSVTIGTKEAEMLKEIVERYRYISTSEAIRDMIRHFYESKKCGE
jgi:Arc/MetJ-type ribon-helix-helix transcriptional regulator